MPLAGSLVSVHGRVRRRGRAGPERQGYRRRGANLAAAAAWIRDHDDTRLIHYEGDHESASYTDLYSKMYVEFDELEAVGRHREPRTADPADDAHRRALPFILCEYGHPMGNGPGGLADYQEIFRTHSRLAGGFIWEWIDHGIAQTSADGTPSYAYGGDFGEEIHDGNSTTSPAVVGECLASLRLPR